MSNKKKPSLPKDTYRCSCGLICEREGDHKESPFKPFGELLDDAIREIQEGNK